VAPANLFSPDGVKKEVVKPAIAEAGAPPAEVCAQPNPFHNFVPGKSQTEMAMKAEAAEAKVLQLQGVSNSPFVKQHAEVLEHNADLASTLAKVGYFATARTTGSQVQAALNQQEARSERLAAEKEAVEADLRKAQESANETSSETEVS
jgi:hypothetical protein